MKERVANAFAYDPVYALSWVEIQDGTTSMRISPKNASTACSRTSVTLLSESASSQLHSRTKSRPKPSVCTRLVGGSVAGRFCGFLRFPETACYGDSAFKIIDLVKVSLDRFRYGVEEQRLEAFTDKWDHVLSGISVDRPDDGMLRTLFYEQVRELHCLKLDVQLWNRDASVRNYAYLRNICANAITTWRRRRNQEKMYSATRSSSL